MGIAYSVGEVDHLYTFFVQWSPYIYNKDPEKPLYLMVNNDKLPAIDGLIQVTAPSAKNWEIVTENEPKYCHSMCSFENEEELANPKKLLPDLLDPSHLLDDHHIESLANHMPVRTQGYPWRMVYSTAVHGTSLNTLYREMTDVDSPVLLVIKDMEHNVFGAFSSDPFRVSNCCYGTGETFLYSFSPEFQAYRWSGENCYFVRGHLDALQIGGGGGRFGLWLDSDLYQGSSFACSTFQNKPLSSKQDFKVHALEAWTVQ